MSQWKVFCTVSLFLVICIVFISCEPEGDSNNVSLTPYLNKRYELASGDNDKFEDLMEYLGVGWLMRKAIILAKPVMELKMEENEFTLSSESFFKNIYTKFKLGKEFEEKTPDGREVETMFTADGNKLIQTQKDEQGKLTTVTREFLPEQVIVTAQVDDLSCVRVYKAL